MLYYRRRLPHWIPDQSILFVTWRLAGSSPPSRAGLPAAHNAPTPFAQQDERLARSSRGPFWLSDPRLASMLEQAILYGETVRELYRLHAWVIMPNHMHVILEPHLPLPRIMLWLKGRTGRKANQILGRRGQPFWQDESYDHWVRTPEELNELISYVERNPVHAGLAGSEEQWPWSSARWKADDKMRSSAPQSSIAAAKTVEQAVLLATPAVLPAGSAGETADMAGLAARSTCLRRTNPRARERN